MCVYKSMKTMNFVCNIFTIKFFQYNFIVLKMGNCPCSLSDNYQCNLLIKNKRENLPISSYEECRKICFLIEANAVTFL